LIVAVLGAEIKKLKFIARTIAKNNEIGASERSPVSEAISSKSIFLIWRELVWGHRQPKIFPHVFHPQKLKLDRSVATGDPLPWIPCFLFHNRNYRINVSLAG